MPLSSKGQSILENLEKEYGEKKGKEVLYAGKNKGTFTGIDSARDDADDLRDRVIDAACRSLADSMIGIERASKRMDACVQDLDVDK